MSPNTVKALAIICDLIFMCGLLGFFVYLIYAATH